VIEQQAEVTKSSKSNVRNIGQDERRRRKVVTVKRTTVQVIKLPL
jgi:hypothetical protein